jgi:argininosuccinate lyase
MRINADKMLAGAKGGFMAATDLADYLTARGTPFREAHEIVGKLVLDAEKQGRTLQQLSLADLQAVSGLFDEDALAAVNIESVVARRTSEGGTAPTRVAEQLSLAREQLAKDRG